MRILRYLVATGEALPPSTAKRWICALPKVPIVNAYGPTECSDDVTHEFVSLPQAGQIHTPIGVPIPNSRLYLLVEENGSFRSCDEGEPGELFVGGICVGRGYLGDPDRTRSAFFRDPFVVDERARLYRTGDLVRLTPSGSLEYLGRIDRQVKVGGVRIELGEIEELLRSHGAVSEAAVVFLGASESSQVDPENTRRRSHDRARLVAYVTGTDSYPTKLKAFVSDRLPRAMVPSEFLVLAALPLTPNNKIDFRQLETMARPEHEKGFHTLARPCSLIAHCFTRCRRCTNSNPGWACVRCTLAPLPALRCKRYSGSLWESRKSCRKDHRRQQLALSMSIVAQTIFLC